MKLGRPAFTWGLANLGLANLRLANLRLANLVQEGEARNRYLAAIRAADDGDILPLLHFARS
jgi:hypothetical protein